MKKLLILGLLATGLFAQSHIEKRVDVMKNLEEAMAMVQKGYLYNNIGIVKNGADALKLHAKDVKSFEVESSQDSFDAKQYAINEASAISSLADDMVESFKNGQKAKSMIAYQNTLNRCVTCHKIVRKW
jgi:cytochrome c556